MKIDSEIVNTIQIRKLLYFISNENVIRQSRYTDILQDQE